MLACMSFLWITMFASLFVLLLPAITSVSRQCSHSSLEGSVTPELTSVDYVSVTMVVKYYVSTPDIQNLGFWMEYKKSKDESSPLLSEDFIVASYGDSDAKRTLKVSGLMPNTEYALWLVLKQGDCTLASSTAIQVKTKDLEWTSDSGREYFFSKDLNHALDFATANAFCGDQDGAMLMSISNALENDLVTESLQDSERCWLALRFPHNVDGEGCSSCTYCSDVDVGYSCDPCYSCQSKWYWIDGNNSSFTSWGKEQPTGNHTCAAVMNRGLWLDVSCTEQLYFVCYREAVPTSPALTDWQIATIVVSVALGLFLIAFLVLLGFFCKIRTELKRKVFPQENGVYKNADGKTDITVSF